MRLPLALLLASYALGALAAEPDLLLIDEVRKNQTTIYIGESRYYLDRTSITTGRVESVPYHSARTIMTRPNHPASVDEIAVICNHAALGFAVSIRKIGVAKANTVEYSFDQGPVKSLADFDLKRLDDKPVTVFSKVAHAICNIAQPKVAHAICNIAQPKVAAAPSNNSFKPKPLRGSA
jgi:hypothetical protein